MAGFNISQFKEYVQIFINATQIDNGNGIIEKENGELSKLLSNFGIEESKIGDLLIKSDDSANRVSEAPSEELPIEDIVQEDFNKAYEKYDKMTDAQKNEVRNQAIQYASENYNKMKEVVDPMVEPLYDTLRLTDLPYDNIVDGTGFQAYIAKNVVTFTLRIQKQMEEKIESYDRAFGEYDITYCSPFEFEVKESGILSPISNANKIPEKFMEQVSKKLREYLSEDTTSLTLEANVDLVAKFLEAINSLVENSTNEIKSMKDEVAENYKKDFDASIEGLGSGNPQAIQGAPVQKAFADVVNAKIAAEILSVENDNNQAPKYDISGKLITGDLQPGQIYIQNGKKYVNTQ